jgi:predicted RNA-binding Zn ribbon-like protein
MYHENMAQESTATRLQSRSWVLPEEPAAVRLMNTIWADRAGVHDDLRTTRDLADWLVAISATDGPVRVTKDDVARARRLRDALRRLAALCTDDTRVAAASEVEDIDVAIGEINSLVAVCPPTPRLALLDGRLIGDTATIGPPVTRALTAVASEAVELFTGADSPQLRACQAPGCVLYFLRDHPRREWCSTACGNRARAARHYRRHRRGARADST